MEHWYSATAVAEGKTVVVARRHVAFKQPLLFVVFDVETGTKQQYDVEGISLRRTCNKLTVALGPSQPGDVALELVPEGTSTLRPCSLKEAPQNADGASKQTSRVWALFHTAQPRHLLLVVELVFSDVVSATLVTPARDEVLVRYNDFMAWCPTPSGSAIVVTCAEQWTYDPANTKISRTVYEDMPKTWKSVSVHAANKVACVVTCTQGTQEIHMFEIETGQSTSVIRVQDSLVPDVVYPLQNDDLFLTYRLPPGGYAIEHHTNGVVEMVSLLQDAVHTVLPDPYADNPNIAIVPIQKNGAFARSYWMFDSGTLRLHETALGQMCCCACWTSVGLRFFVDQENCIDLLGVE
jgi:hypothetical protein